MAVPSKAGKDLVQFNCRNGVFSVDGQTVKPLGYLTAINTEKNINTKPLYGDGEIIYEFIDDKGSTGTLEMTTNDTQLEMSLDFLMEIEQGLAEVQVVSSKSIAIGAECFLLTNDEQGRAVEKVVKVWWLDVVVKPASFSLSQNTDGVNESGVSYPLTIKGVPLMDKDGISTYVDENGNTRKVSRVTCRPSDKNYATFLDTVPVPKVKGTV